MKKTTHLRVLYKFAEKKMDTDPTVYRNGAASEQPAEPVARNEVDFDQLNPDNIEDALQNMRLFDEAYNSDEDCRVSCLVTGLVGGAEGDCGIIFIWVLNNRTRSS